MGKPLPWAMLHWKVSELESQRIADNMKHAKRNKVTVSNTSVCTVCTDPLPHSMRNRVVSCASATCADACVAPLKCMWKCKTLTCSKSGLVNIYELGVHEVKGNDPPSGCLTFEQKQTARQLAVNGLKPARIRSALSVGTSVENIPQLSKVQNFVTYCRKTELNNTDELDVLQEIVRAKAYTGQEEDSCAFSFSSNTGSHGEIVVGEGTNSDAFFVGFTTKVLLKRLDRDPRSFIFHFDPTYKLNQVGYPIFVCGISDHARSFHLVALFVVSQQEVAVELDANTARMERDAQPEDGWPVDLTTCSCPCKYVFHKGHCVHLLFALYSRFGTDQPGKKKLFNRSRRSKR